MSPSTPHMASDEDALRESIDQDSRNAGAHYSLGYMLSHDPARVHEAEAALRTAIELEPRNPQFAYRLGLPSHENLHDFVKAETAYRRAVELAPTDPYYYGGLINLLVQQQRYAEAVALGAN